MNRQEFGQLLNLEENLIPVGRHNRPGSFNTLEFITIHNTDNTDAGADARAHANFLRNTGFYRTESGEIIWVSWHYSVDDQRTVKHLPINEVAYHARNNANVRSIGIEICMNQGINQQAANLRAARLVAALLYDLRKTIGIVRTHNSWTNKNCPRLLLNNGQHGQRWNAFKALIDSELASIDPATADALDSLNGTDFDAQTELTSVEEANFPVHN